MAQAILGGPDDEPQPRRRGDKDGEREGGMMQLVRRLARLLTARLRGAGVLGDLRAGREAITQRAPVADYGFTGAYLSPLGSPNALWEPHTDFAGFVDEGFVAAQDHHFPQL